MLFVGFSLFINQTKEIRGSTVKVTWKQELCSSHAVLYVYYREVLPGINARRWEDVRVPQLANHYNLELKCFKQFEIAVTERKALDKLNPWKVKTGQGKKKSI